MQTGLSGLYRLLEDARPCLTVCDDLHIDLLCRLLLQDPNSRTQQQLSVIRAFKDAAYKMQDCKDSLVRFISRLAECSLFYEAWRCGHGHLETVILGAGNL